MTGLKQLRNRVKSIKSTQKITKAMQVVSAAKLKKIKEHAEKLNDYCAVLGDIMYDISTSGNIMELPLEDQRFFSKDLEELPTLLVILTSERGLCGGFNSSVIKRAKKDIIELNQEGKEVKLLIIGKKGRDAFKSVYSNQVVKYYNIVKDNSEAIALQIKNEIISLVENREVGPCYLYYNKFKNAITQIMTKQQILPIDDASHTHATHGSEYEYEGNKLVHEVINLYINGQINYTLLQSRASEEGARMTAMDNATRNAGELIDKLTLKLNRSRQAMITTELTEIISGAESV